MKKKIGLKEALRNDGNFLAFLAQEARSDEYRKLKKKAHPTKKMLYDYVLGWLDKKDAMKIRNHFSFCGSCADEVLRIMRIEDDLKKKSVDWVNPEASGEIEEPGGVATLGGFAATSNVNWIPNRVPLATLGFAAVGKPFCLTLNILTDMISLLWKPKWAGVPVVAAGIPEQSHFFKMDDGEIKISCYWEPKFRNDPAYIHLSWSARITKPVRLWARFVNPESNEIRSEIHLGTHLQGEDNFTSDRLGFDPSNEKWAISIIFQEEK